MFGARIKSASNQALLVSDNARLIPQVAGWNWDAGISSGGSPRPWSYPTGGNGPYCYRIIYASSTFPWKWFPDKTRNMFPLLFVELRDNNVGVAIHSASFLIQTWSLYLDISVAGDSIGPNYIPKVWAFDPLLLNGGNDGSTWGMILRNANNEVTFDTRHTSRPMQMYSLFDDFYEDPYANGYGQKAKWLGSTTLPSNLAVCFRPRYIHGLVANTGHYTCAHVSYDRATNYLLTRYHTTTGSFSSPISGGNVSAQGFVGIIDTSRYLPGA